MWAAVWSQEDNWSCDKFWFFGVKWYDGQKVALKGDVPPRVLIPIDFSSAWSLREGLSAKWLARLPSHLPGCFAHYRAVQECSTTAGAAPKTPLLTTTVTHSLPLPTLGELGKHCRLMVRHSTWPVIDSSTTVICTRGTVIGVNILAHIFAAFKDGCSASQAVGKKTPSTAIPWCCNMGLTEGSFLVWRGGIERKTVRER